MDLLIAIKGQRKLGYEAGIIISNTRGDFCQRQSNNEMSDEKYEHKLIVHKVDIIRIR